ncbi:hypothetical protein [Nocardia sp. bgisy134]|uniref:hypothetical protein n=1 Tax=Nocardia sp. bgisy134 TaxID=3413789 RepID=UPI003D71EC53
MVWAYLGEIQRVLAGSEAFAVFCHIDYAVRAWPIATAGPFDPRRFEEGFRTAMRAIAVSGRALEINTRHLRPWTPQWWAEEGGRAVTFGSDATSPKHSPTTSPSRRHDRALRIPPRTPTRGLLNPIKSASKTADAH